MAALMRSIGMSSTTLGTEGGQISKFHAAVFTAVLLFVTAFVKGVATFVDTIGVSPAAAHCQGVHIGKIHSAVFTFWHLCVLLFVWWLNLAYHKLRDLPAGKHSFQSLLAVLARLPVIGE
jgi:hypothetical protein